MLLDEIDKLTLQINNEFGNLTTEQLSQRPNESTWSIAENLEHLIIMNQSYLNRIRELREGDFKPPISGKFLPLTMLNEKMLKMAVEPGRKIKMKTFSSLEPQQKNYSGILQQFFDHQTYLKNAIEQNADLIKNRSIISSPVNKFVTMRIDQVFEILIMHEKRHFNQALEASATLFRS